MRSLATVLSSASALRRLKRSTMLLHVGPCGLAAQIGAVGLGRQTGTLAGADLLALERDALDAGGELVTLEQRLDERVDGGEDGQRRKDGDQRLRGGHDVEEELQHRRPLEIEVDHLAHDHDADDHPHGGSSRG